MSGKRSSVTTTPHHVGWTRRSSAFSAAKYRSTIEMGRSGATGKE